MSKKTEDVKSEINLLVLMQQQDNITAAFVELLFSCPFCGKKLAESETRGFGGGNPWLSCACGASMHGGLLELLQGWNRRDGQEFTLESEYAQRLVRVKSEYASFKTNAFAEFKRLKKSLSESEGHLAEAYARIRELESKGGAE